MTYEDGSVYEGYWQHDKQHGFGTLRYAGGAIYRGKFRKGNVHGHGEMKHAEISLSRPLQTTSSGNYAANPNWPIVFDPSKPVKVFGATEVLDPTTHEMRSAL